MERIASVAFVAAWLSIHALATPGREFRQWVAVGTVAVSKQNELQIWLGRPYGRVIITDGFLVVPSEKHPVVRVLALRGHIWEARELLKRVRREKHFKVELYAWPPDLVRNTILYDGKWFMNPDHLL